MKHAKYLCLAALSSMAAIAVPEVSNVSFVQSGSSRTVTIGYTVSESAIVTIDILTNAVDETSGASIGSENLGWMSGDANKLVAAGSHVVTWQPDKAWPGHKIVDQSVRAKVTAWAIDNPPDIMVVDLVRTNGATSYGVTYYISTNTLPGGLLGNSEYRTSKIVMKRVRAPECGTYVMGNLRETGHRSDEYQHTVWLTNDYYLSVFEVTQAQYMKLTGSYPGSLFTVSRDFRPAEKVTSNGWRGTQYPNVPSVSSPIGLLTSRTDYAFDFPSEAQWEYACRAGNYEGFWPDGSAIDLSVSNTANTEETNLSRQARYIINGYGRDGNGVPSVSPTASTAPADGGTAEVGSYEPNAWGFYDMLGNVNEFCLDCYKAVNYQDDGHVILPSEGDDSTKVVARGGCYWEHWYNTRSSRRSGVSVTQSQQTYGCRLACPITPKE